MTTPAEQLMVVGLFSGEDSVGSTRVPGRETRRTAEMAGSLATYLSADRLVMVGIHGEDIADFAYTHNPFMAIVPSAHIGNGDLLEDVHDLKLNLINPTESTDLLICTVDYRKQATEFIFAQVFGPEFSLDYRYVDTARSSINAGDDRQIRKRESIYLRQAKRFLKGIGPNEDARRDIKLRSRPEAPTRRRLINH